MEAERRGKLIPLENEREQLILDEHLRGHFGTQVIFDNLWEKGYWWNSI